MTYPVRDYLLKALSRHLAAIHTASAFNEIPLAVAIQAWREMAIHDRDAIRNLYTKTEESLDPDNEYQYITLNDRLSSETAEMKKSGKLDELAEIVAETMELQAEISLLDASVRMLNEIMEGKTDE